MLTDPAEIAIIAQAKQQNVRDPRRSRVHFENILDDYFTGLKLSGHRVLDIGPGQFDFGVLAQQRGANVIGIDRDPAVLELGRHKGFAVVDADFRHVVPGDLAEPFDGIFCKFSLNAFWFHDDPAGLRQHLDAFLRPLGPRAWGWVAPWNGVPKSATLTPSDIQRTLAAQRAIFADYGFAFLDLTEIQTRRYGIHGRTADNALFVRNLPIKETRP